VSVLADIRRSWLFTPGERPERFAKGSASGADAVILDVEDAVVHAAKARARARVTDRLGSGRSPQAWTRC
jgi:citrate lyase beta subunit